MHTGLVPSGIDAFAVFVFAHGGLRMHCILGLSDAVPEAILEMRHASPGAGVCARLGAVFAATLPAQPESIHPKAQFLNSEM